MKNTKGFTLIEIMIVFTILAVLTVMGFIAWQNQAAKARDARRKTDLKRLATAFEDYYADTAAYPPATIIDNCGGAELKPYLDQPIPCDPITHNHYCYIYDSDSPAGQEFRILTALENDSDPDISRLGCNGPGFCGYEAECATPLSSGFNYGFNSTNITLK